MSCPLQGHDKQRVKYICVDKACRSSKKIGCADCFLENHATHKRMKLEEFQQSARTKACTLLNMKFDVLREDDVTCKDYEFDSIISECLIDRQKTIAKEQWKRNIKQKLYESNKSCIESSMTHINRMDQLLKEGSYTQAKYQEMASIYFNPDFWTTLAKNKLEESMQSERLVAKKDKYFNKMYSTSTDGLLRDLNFDDYKSTNFEDYTDNQKAFPSPDQVKDTTQRKQFPRTRHFGTTAQKLFNVPPTKKYKFSSP